MKTDIHNKNIVLGVCGGIAAYKSVEFLRLLKKEGANVRVMMTQNATAFVGTLTFEALSDRPVCTSLFEKGGDSSIKHIDWAEEADAVVIAPATANIIGKCAGGIADDALSTFLLAVTSPVIVCPSMNTHMYQSRAMQRNLDILRDDGYFIAEPGSGELACGTTGPGRLPDPPEILDRLLYCLSPKNLEGKKVLVTAGPTREHIDPVRFISNPSSGKMGYAIARAAEHRGAEVVLVTGPTNIPVPLNVTEIRVRSAREMATAVFEHMEDSHIIIKTAAVADYRPGEAAAHKIKKGADEKVLTLQKNQDILKELGARKKDQILVGFAAETQELEKNAGEKLVRKNLDMIAGNIVGESSGFETDTNQVTLFYRDGTKEPLPVMEKDAVAHILLDRIIGIKN
ncbi:bifunctional phosphopantothenoylcysteine decarboxylase/phosphopantothenate--cysteine ligase CoaBC [Desulfonema magnum]|uniref:Coenzyme A biosynthesis bifunctional protein CoaBC n=1 Tax=Desulfonema magnum TaxID=45655 RepID=A0A975BTA7_9BACT|nr:bifunctional phosphopantothenoylcysteine decarboxylase/phosphopantothenate--cysteine ligase CoaBC [Desulfonema magnum]QTA91023.1 Coenzyme A biosynthesis bifunctional protein [Desulfonema magnum]